MAVKTFKDLAFKRHTAGVGGAQAVMDFDNGFGVSVITGKMFYTSPGSPYEVGILQGGRLTYATGITEDVIGHQTESEVTEIMRQVQELKKEMQVVDNGKTKAGT